MPDRGKPSSAAPALFACWLCLALLCTSCATYRRPTTAYGPAPADPYYTVRQQAVQSPLYGFVPRRREQLPVLDARWLTWALLGNDEDGIFGEDSGPKPYSTNITFGAFCAWSLARNPLHNFDFYVIGSADWDRHYNFSLLSLGGTKTARACSNAAKWPAGDRPWLNLGFNDFKPYVTLEPWRLDLFLGWRKNGAFEIKARANGKK